MATMIEKQIAKANKDIEKFTKAVSRHTALLAKKTAKSEELDCVWTWDEWIAHRETQTYTQEQYMAWAGMRREQEELEEAKKHLADAEKHLAKLTGESEAKAEQEAETARVNQIENNWWKILKEEMEKTPEQRKAEFEAWLKEFKAECAKDGIVIEDASSNWISGTTAGKKHFSLIANNGFTTRSYHCYTLRIAGETIFTSGEFGTAYEYIRKH